MSRSFHPWSLSSLVAQGIFQDDSAAIVSERFRERGTSFSHRLQPHENPQNMLVKSLPVHSAIEDLCGATLDGNNGYYMHYPKYYYYLINLTVLILQVKSFLLY